MRCNMKIIVFGTGSYASEVTEHIGNIAYYVDNDVRKQGKFFCGKIVHAPSVLLEELEFKVIIASTYLNEIKMQLENMGFNEEEHYIDVKEAYVPSVVKDNNAPLLKVIDEYKHLQAKQLIEINKNRKQLEWLYDVEFKVYSQWGEDGIIQYLINKIDIPVKKFIEFGVEDYKESNTHFLLTNNNWEGLVIEMSEEDINKIKNDDIYWKYSLKAVNSFITKDNINQLFVDNGFDGDIGLLSVDVDGNDYWIWGAIDVIQPRIVVCEYNSVLSLDQAVTIPYVEDFYRTNAHYSNLYWGASLKAMYELAKKKGYQFVGTNSVSTNAFFVREDVIGELDIADFEKYNCYSKIRESRDEQGKLSYLDGMDRVNAIKDMPVIDVEEMKGH